MGEANRRGTFEERKQKAVTRNQKKKIQRDKHIEQSKRMRMASMLKQY